MFWSKAINVIYFYFFIRKLFFYFKIITRTLKIIKWRSFGLLLATWNLGIHWTPNLIGKHKSEKKIDCSFDIWAITNLTQGLMDRGSQQTSPKPNQILSPIFLLSGPKWAQDPITSSWPSTRYSPLIKISQMWVDFQLILSCALLSTDPIMR